MTRRWSRVSAVAAVAALTLAGCSSDEKTAENLIEKAAEQGGEDVDVDVDGDEVTIENSDGTVSLGGDLPEGFPEDVPLVDGEVLMGLGAQDQGYQVTLSVEGSAEEALDEAVDLLEDAGFTLGETVDMGELHSATLTSDAYEVSVTSTGADAETTLIYAVEVL